MGMISEGQIRDAVNKHGKEHTQYLSALLMEQKRTNELLTALLQAMSGPQGASQAPTWARH